MSYYLNLFVAYPIAGTENELRGPGGSFTAVTRIAVTQDYAIYGQINPSFARYRDHGRQDIPEQPHIHPQPLPADVAVTMGDRIVRKDAYGSPLTWLTAREICDLRPPQRGWDPWMTGVLAMLRAIPPETPIVLWWD